MLFDNVLRLTSIVLAGSSFAGLGLGTPFPHWLLWLVGVALIVAALRTAGSPSLDRLVSHVTVSATLWNVLLGLGFAGFWVDLIWLSGDLLRAGIHFLVLLLLVKLGNLRQRRDYVHLYAISLMALLASAASTTDLWYLPLFLIYLVATVWTMLLFHLTKPSLPSEADAAPDRRVTRPLFWLANGLAVGTLTLTVLIFFALPRVSAGFLKHGPGESIRTSGFSDTVNLGAIGPIKRDPSIVMRVELPDTEPGQLDRLYLRGVAYDRYDGASWTNQFTHRRMLHEPAPALFTVRQHSSPTTRGPALRQNILLESLDTAVLFAAPFAESVAGRFPMVQSDAAGSLYLPFPSASRIEYAVVSRTHLVSPADRQPQTVVYPESFVRHFLQTPHQSDRVAALAWDITRDYASAYEKAVALERYLSHNFRYSLDVPLSSLNPPIEDFLFTRKTGYCEHYATAMVIMLRAIGIPARLVTGFLATEWNEYGNYFLVRQQDAHAWVEVHLPQSGWVTMDPTPEVVEGLAAPQWHAFSRVVDHLQLRWNRLFVHYSAADQLAMVRDVKAGSATVGLRAWETMTAFIRPFFASFAHVGSNLGANSVPGLAGITGVVLVALGGMWWAVRAYGKGTGPVQSPVAPAQAVVCLYANMLTYLSSRGFSKTDATAPLEFACMIRTGWTSADAAVTTITGLYCRARFGRTPPTANDLRLAEDSLRQLMALEHS